MTDSIKQKALELPRVPGCYLFKDAKGVIIYVGKAKNLKNRVGSYFQSGIDPVTKTGALVQRIVNIEYIEAASELEAFILESELIKKYQPKYNIDLKDDKSYLYIVIRNEKLLLKNLPKVLTARKTDLLEGDITFGPYPDGKTTKYIVRAIRRLIPFRDCATTKFSRYVKLKKPCLYGDIGLCAAPCVFNSEKDLSDYKLNINHIKGLLAGETSKVINNIKKQMEEASALEQYEDAAKYRDLLQKFEYIRQHSHSPEEYISNPYLIDDIADQALKELQKQLPHLKKLSAKIECYDIANISGKEAVGSLVCAVSGKIDKRFYRKFQIKLKNKPDDFDMMREVLYRRLNRGIFDTTQKWTLPDLIVVDGGKGQVSAALDIMRELHLSIPVIGLAKKFETIVFFGDEGFVEVFLDKSNSGLKLLISLRDEAHRFAQSYHHLLRKKSVLGNG